MLGSADGTALSSRFAIFFVKKAELAKNRNKEDGNLYWVISTTTTSPTAGKLDQMK